MNLLIRSHVCTHTVRQLAEGVAATRSIINLASGLDDTADKPFAFCPTASFP
jgi:hypothetical protein